jgi:hypothetical protein
MISDQLKLVKRCGVVATWALLSASASLVACSTDEKPGTSGKAGDASIETFAKASELPTCNSAHRAAVYYVSSESAFYYCDGEAYQEFPVVGAPGTDGTPWLVSTKTADTADCSNGGLAISVGPDMDGDGTLSASEAAGTDAACNGVDGAPGPTGPSGADGENGADGQDGNDGQNGADGQDGQDGQNGADGQQGPAGNTALIATAPAPSEQCQHGGLSVSSGLDVDADGILEPEEVQHTDYVCSSAPGVDGLSALVAQTAEPPGENCAAGGTRVDAGLDTDSDGVLDASEITSTSYVCGRVDAPAPVVAGFHDETCDETAAPDVAKGVFVDASLGDDVIGMGTPESPLKTLSKAVALAVASARTNVYLTEGEYAAVTLPQGSILYVEGAWVRGTAWHRNCATGARETTVISGQLSAEGVFGGLRSLTVLAENAASNIAVRAAAGSFVVRSSVISAGAALDGAPGANGVFGTSGTVGGACSSGAPGQAAANGAASSGGSFQSNGTYRPGDGTAGLAGTNGQGGTTATPVNQLVGSCTTNYTPYSCNPHSCNPYSCNCSAFGGCQTCYDTCYDTCYEPSCSYSGSSTPVVGSCGGGAQGGGPAGFGGGGGASVALSIASGAAVSVFGSVLTAGDGGDGAAGGLGGPGGIGSLGQGVTFQSDEGFCGSAPSCTEFTSSQTAPAGGKGGDGGKGANGGNGAGGPSYGVVRLGSAVANLSADTTVTFGAAGVGAPGAPNGAADGVVTLP